MLFMPNLTLALKVVEIRTQFPALSCRELQPVWSFGGVAHLFQGSLVQEMFL